MRDTPKNSSLALWVVGSRKAELRPGTLGNLEEDEARVRTRFSAISRGTETLVFSGLVPQSEYERMRAPFQEGEFPAPVKYGYINVGVVEAGPSDLVGTTVFSLAPHQDVLHLPASSLTPVPDAVPAERAILTAGMETALNALWDSQLSAGDRVLVVGGGVIGLLCGYLAARTPGCEVLVVDTEAAREAPAIALGCRFATALPDDFEADVVFHATGHSAGLETALAGAGLEAAIVELSWYGTRDVRVPLGHGFHAKRLRLRSSQVGRLPASHAARWDYARRLRTALGLLEDATLDVLITGESAFADLPETLAAVCSSGHLALCHRIRYPEP